MNNLYSFIEFISESYLEGSRQPLYHVTNSLLAIIKNDTLKTHEPAHKMKNMLSISLTRSDSYLGDYGFDNKYRLVLDSDKLKNSGYNSYSSDELGSMGGRNHNVQKWNYFIRHPKHNLNLPKSKDKNNMQIEYEERIYKDINNLGKYIIYIDILHTGDIKNITSEILYYLEKYPHIKIRIFSKNSIKILDFNNLKIKYNINDNSKIRTKDNS